MRVLGRIRLSRLTEESTSADRQRELIQRWADDHGHEVIGWAEDIDVSGSVDPFDTPQLGRWLQPGNREQWDIVVAWKLDRLGRDAIRLNKLFGWARDHSKTVVSATEGIDLSTPVGLLIANVIAFLAEGELDAIRERTKASRKKLAELGRWAGGKPIYGYTAKERKTGGWELVIDPKSSKVLLQIINMFMSGVSLNCIAEDLNNSGELSPADYNKKRSGKKTNGHLWRGETIARMLRSKTLIGYATHNRRVVLDDQGEVVRIGEPLITPAQFELIQNKLLNRKINVRSRDTSPLLGVVLCTNCGGSLFFQKMPGNNKEYRYYYCRPCRTARINRAIPADTVEELVEYWFMHHLADKPVQERVYVPASSAEIELEAARSAVDELSTLAGTMTSETVRSRLYGQLKALDERILVLEAQPATEAAWNYVPGDQTYREAWENTDTEGRRQLLIKSGITATASKPYAGGNLFHMNIPHDLLERLSA